MQQMNGVIHKNHSTASELHLSIVSGDKFE